MSADQELVLIFGALHLMALVFGGLLLTMFVRSETRPAWRPPADEDGPDGGGDDGPAPVAPHPPGRAAGSHTFRLPA